MPDFYSIAWGVYRPGNAVAVGQMAKKLSTVELKSRHGDLRGLTVRHTAVVRLRLKVTDMKSLIHDTQAALFRSARRDVHSWTRAQTRDGKIVCIARSVYLDADFLLAQPTLWDQRRVINVARIMAVSSLRRAQPCFVRESALVMMNLSLMNTNPSVKVHSDRKKMLSPTQLPAITIGGKEISPPTEVMSVSATGVDSATREVCGVIVTAETRTATDIARFLPSQEAVPQLSEMLRQACGYDRYAPEEHLACAQNVKQQWLDALEYVPRLHGISRARTLIAAASVQCDSIAEGSFLWLLHASGAVPWRQQVPITIDGRIYFADVLFPSVKVMIEIEGREKLGPTEEDIQTNLHQLMSRDNELESLGLRVVHLTAKDVMWYPHRALAHLKRVCPEIFMRHLQIPVAFRDARNL